MLDGAGPYVVSAPHTSLREYHHSSRVRDGVFLGEQKAPYHGCAIRSLTLVDSCTVTATLGWSSPL